MSSRTSTRLAVAVALGVLVTVLGVLFSRLAGTLGVDGTAVNEPPTSIPAQQESTATGSLAPAGPSSSSPASTPPTSSPGSSTPATSSSVPPSTSPNAPTTTVAAESSFDDPATWPDALPAVGEHKLLDYTAGEEQIWLFAVPGTIAQSGGRFVGGLERDGWDVASVSTMNTVTAVGSLEGQRVSAVLRAGDQAVPEGWQYLEVVYSPSIPSFAPPSTTTPEQSARSRS